MGALYLFMVLIVSAHAKVVLDHNEDVHLSNEISKNDPEINLTTIASEYKWATKIAAEPSGNEIDGDLVGDISTTEEVPEIHVDNGTALILTPYIKDGRIVEARNASRVDSKLFLDFESYSGFLTVNETLRSHLFFWYFPVPDKPVNETPWILWLQGGPGASSMTGLFDEIGPVNYSPYGKLKKNPYTWLANHSLLFIDNPVGTGYSYTESEDGFAIDLDTYATHLYTAMKQFVQLFPELQNAPLFVAGESYAGKYVPALAMKIHEHKEWPGGHFNLQYFGLMDQTQLDTIKPLVEGFQADIANNRSVEAKHKWVNLISTLLFFSHQKHAYNFLRDDLNVAKYTAFLATSEVKRALHVGDIKFSYLNVTVNTKLAPDFLSNTKPMMEVLLEHYRVLVGQLDQMLPCLSTSRNYRTWKWNGTQEFLQAVRFPYIFNSRLAGYYKTGGQLTEVVLRGAGHMVPLDAPAPAQAMLAHWTRGEPICLKMPFYEGNFIQSFLRNNTVINI
ncbi:hypothetical protein MSG28_002462 [Choristoneura fumiferana]|uniref:Uncharacterized protein n=1 Tax=Choristoneura fumiferana TaxID=7141 RepID=A0ACC0JVJ6_CHOFU|nr:hypothetical protein MSG28_002462 [Choristoneura fumiferana]